MNITLPTKKSLSDNDIASIRDRHAPLIPIIFDKDYYLANSADVRQSSIDPFKHFCNNGYSEGRNPSPLISITYCKWLAKQRDVELNSVEEFFQFVSRIDCSDWFGPHPYLSPRWIAAQLQIEDPGRTSIINLMTTTPTTSKVSWHPAISQAPLSNGTLTRSFIEFTKQNLGDHLLVDLKQYVYNHKDLQVHFAKREDILASQIFLHMFSTGLTENRLKYLGTAAPRWATIEELFQVNAIAILKSSTIHLLHPASAPVNSLSNRPMRLIDGSTHEIDRLMNQRAQPGMQTPDVDFLITLNEIASEKIYTILRTPHDKELGKHISDSVLAAPASRQTRELLDLQLISGTSERRDTHRHVVYSILLGGYDDPPVPPELDGCGYYLITDAMLESVPEPWMVVRPTIQERDTKRSCIWYKTHPHVLFPNAEFTTWIDANIVCESGSEKILASHEHLSEVATFRHPDRSCIWAEAEEVLKLSLDVTEAVNLTLQKLENSGMPRDWGLYETNVLFTRKSDLAVQDFLEHWWHSVATGSRRDQLSFTYSAWLKKVEISQLDGTRCAKNSKYFKKRPHKSRAGRFL